MQQGVLRFAVSDALCQFCYEKDGAPALNVRLEEGRLCVWAYYTASDKPLLLSGNAKAGDAVRLVLQPFRIELYVNDQLLDEEWPFGDACFADAELTQCNVELTQEEILPPCAEPCVTGSFTGAEGWYPGNGVFVGDCMPYTFAGRYHLLYLKDRRHHGSKWGKGAHQWAHISSADLQHWDVHPMAVTIDDAREGSICTGSWIFEGGRHYLYYTVRMADGSSAPICRSVSEDGYHFSKDTTFHFTLSALYTGASARDPKVVRGADGCLHMFVTTTQVATGKGCLVHLTSEDGEQWAEQGTIYVAPDAGEPECPDYFAYRGRYYLIFSHGARAQYRYSDKPFTDWQMPENPNIPCHSVPKAAIWQDRIIFAGFIGLGGYAGSLTFMEATVDEKGELTYLPVREMQA